MIDFLRAYWIEVVLSVWIVANVWIVARIVRRRAPYLLDAGPAERGSVSVGNDGVTWTLRDRRETLPWSQVAAVRVRTTSGGPIDDDLFLELEPTVGSGRLRIPSEAEGFSDLLGVIGTRLPGFDMEAMVEATMSFEDGERVLWTRAGDPSRRSRPGGAPSGSR